MVIKIQKACSRFIRMSAGVFASSLVLDPDIMSEIAKRMEERPFTFLDINMGCPVPKIVKNSEGSA